MRKEYRIFWLKTGRYDSKSFETSKDAKFHAETYSFEYRIDFFVGGELVLTGV